MVRDTIAKPPPEAVALAFLKAQLQNTLIYILCGRGKPTAGIHNCPGNRDFDAIARLLSPSYQHAVTQEEKNYIRDQLIARFQFVVWYPRTRSYIPFYKETEQKTRRFLELKARAALTRTYPLDPNVPVRIYATLNAIGRFFNDRPDPEYHDDDDYEVTVLAVVPAPAPLPAPLPSSAIIVTWPIPLR